MILCLKYSEYGCGATFKKWKSFRQHLFRKHYIVPAVFEDEQLEHFPDMYIPNEEVPHVQNENEGINLISMHIRHLQ